ncbi:MAG: cysteine dioxygenase family protein [Planctomycetes bacterium]|nr:cysteine dioxygenase family protein [Planctomycetota bacterium]
MAIKPYTLSEFLAEMDRYEHRVPLDRLEAMLQQLDLAFEDVQEYARFGPDRYQRNLIRSGPAYSALLLCWRPGQRSPIHDHRGSSCGVRVIRGIATETLFERTRHGHVFATATHDMHEGGVCGSQDDDMHQVSNLQGPDEDLITLHVYSPPLLVMGLYSLMDTTVREFLDPVASLCDGAGI